MMLWVLFLLVSISMLTRHTLSLRLESPNQPTSRARNAFLQSRPWMNASGVYWKGEKVAGVQGGDDYYNYEEGEEGGGPALLRSGMGETHGDVININYHIHEIVFSDDDSPKCIEHGEKCDGSVGCCDHKDDPDKSLCNHILKKCVKCTPSLGDKCNNLFETCCDTGNDDEIYCLPRKEDGNNYGTTGICQKFNCIHKEGEKCDSKKKCCGGFECKSGTCRDCRHKKCSSSGAGCCDSYYCDKGTCYCRNLGQDCSKRFPCCPQYACASGAPGLGFRGNYPRAYEAICVPRSGCADGKKPCSKGLVCVNDVCLHKCLRTDYQCGVEGDNRSCCKGSDRCHRTCDNYCFDHFNTYCSDGNKQETGCECGEGSYCKKNHECHKNTCCHHEKGSNCAGRGRCSEKPKSWITGCMGGRNGAYIGGVSVPTATGHGGVAQPGEGYGKCPF